MKKSDWLRSIIEAVIWFFFIYYFLYFLKNPVNLYWASFMLLVLAYIGVLVCPWVRHTEGWRRMTGKEM